MGNSYQKIKVQALKEREIKFQSDMKLINQSCQSLGLTLGKATEIATFNVYQCVKLMNKGQLTSQEILTALALRCSTVGRQLNIFTVTNFQQALQMAKKCDIKRKQSGMKNWEPENDQYNSQKYLPPLFGIPISIKDVFHVEELTTTLGLSSKAFNYEQQSPLVTCCKNAGLIPFIKTNVPQLAMAFQTSNHLWGRTLNPWNKHRSVGGSSGGEGAIVSARCSLLGIGSDIGGSIRIPSDHCGIFGLKPYSKRISSKFHAWFSQAFGSFSIVIPLCIGPMGKSAKDLALFMDVASNEQNYQGLDDPYTKIIPFEWKKYQQTEKQNKKYRIGYINSMKDIEPSLASRRALQQTLQILRKEGHELIQIQIPRQKQVLRQFIRQYLAGKLKYLRQLLQGEQQIKQYKTLFTLSEMWTPLKYFVSIIAKRFQPRPHFYFLEKKQCNTVLQYQKHIGQIAQLRGLWIKYWKSNKLDFVLCPGFGCQALPHQKSDQVGLIAAYTFVWNVLDMVAGSIPVTLVKQDQLKYESAHCDLITSQLHRIAEHSSGLPAGVQIIGLPYEEQRVLGFMSYLQNKIQFYKKHPLPDV